MAVNDTVVGDVQGLQCAARVLQQAALVDEFHLALLSREVFALQSTHSVLGPGHSQLLGVIEEFEPHMDEAGAGRDAGASLGAQGGLRPAALSACLSLGQALDVQEMLQAGLGTASSPRLPCGVSPTFAGLFSLLIITL